MSDSIFTKIIKGEIPCHKIYEDDLTIAFMDIYPVQEGMVLVVPKHQIADFFDLPEKDYLALWATVKKVSKKLQTTFPEKSRIGIQIEGLEVPHTHVKLLPIDSGEEFRKEPDMSAEPDHTALALVAKRLTIKS